MKQEKEIKWIQIRKKEHKILMLAKDMLVSLRHKASINKTSTYDEHIGKVAACKTKKKWEISIYLPNSHAEKEIRKRISPILASKIKYLRMNSIMYMKISTMKIMNY
jgi:hypothetical protein